MIKQKKKRERFDYMIAWRDRYIERLHEKLAGRAEENALLAALLFCSLRGGDQSESQEVFIEAQQLRDALNVWECRTERRENGYLLHFARKECADDVDAAKG